MKRAILLSLLSILCGIAHAGDARLSWSAPTQRVDGSALENLAGYNVFWGTAPRGYDFTATVEDPATLTYFIDGLAAGTWYFAVTAFDATGLESAYSAEVSKTIEQSLPPLPPAEPAIVPGGTQFAYIITQAGGRLVLTPVGTVAPGTQCDSSQAARDANGLTAFRIPEASVTWSGSVRRSLVFSPCGN
jgi:hypothetical protein